MYSLSRIVVNPRFVQGEIVCDSFEGNELYGIHQRRRIIYNVATGAVMENLPKVKPSDFRTSDGRMSMRDYLDEIQTRKTAIKLEPYPTLSGVGLQLLIALANHQVNGDQITKGLKAQGIDLGVKFQESFLGGWNITDKNGQALDIEQVIRMITS